MVVIETAHISFASSPVHDIKGLSRFVRQSDSILSDESVMANDKCVTKEANKLAEFIYARRNNQKKKPRQNIYKHDFRLSIHISDV